MMEEGIISVATRAVEVGTGTGSVVGVGCPLISLKVAAKQRVAGVVDISSDSV